MHEIRFIDSFKFMASSLDNLVSNLSEDQLIQIKNVFGDKTYLFKRKGVYRYEYMKSTKNFEETKLPVKGECFSNLNGTHISHQDIYWKEFDMKTMGDYHDIYLQSDVFLLADVFEAFRKVCLENYNLDPAWYFTAPGLSWDATLKITRVKLELITDVDMLLMFEKGTRGGISMITKRFARANNKYMGEKFNKNLLSKFIAYLDANNLYGWAVRFGLTFGNFRWMKDPESEYRKGTPCILEVDLKYPENLHDLHNDFPLAPESLMINGV